MAQQIAAVRRDLDIQNCVIREKRRDRLADFCVGGKNQESVAVFGKAEFTRTAKHPLRFDAAQFARLDFQIVHQHCARQSERNFVADLVVLRAANNLARLTAAVIDLANAQPIRVRMLRRRRDLRDDYVVEIRPALCDPFDFDPGESEQFGQLLDRG